MALRLREAREAAGLSQRQLGIVAELDVSVASPHINQYEQGKHMPNLKCSKSWGSCSTARCHGSTRWTTRLRR